VHDPSPGSRARSQLAGTTFADVRWLAETGSTNADVIALGRAGEPEGVVVVADHQTAGRGRLGRSWQAPPNASLLCTVLLRPPAAVASATTMAVAVAAADAVREVTGVSVRLKWPNDLVCPGDGSSPDRKLAGILAELDWPARGAGGTTGVVVAVGIGINVAWGDDVPADLADVAVALDHLIAPRPAPDRAELLVAFLRHLDTRYRHLVADADGIAELQSAWRQRSATLGRRVRIDLGGDDLEGTAVDITTDGHLVVERDDGERRTVAVGDVVHLRPV